MDLLSSYLCFQTHWLADQQHSHEPTELYHKLDGYAYWMNYFMSALVLKYNYIQCTTESGYSVQGTKNLRIQRKQLISLWLLKMDLDTFLDRLFTHILMYSQ